MKYAKLAEVADEQTREDIAAIFGECDPFGLPINPADLELFEDVETGDPIDQPDCPDCDYPSPEQLAAEAGCELPF